MNYCYLFFYQVQVIGLLCRTPKKESRHELLRRVAAGGGVFKSENGTKLHIPGANLNDIANQADDLLEVVTLKNWSFSWQFRVYYRFDSFLNYLFSFLVHQLLLLLGFLNSGWLALGLVTHLAEWSSKVYFVTVVISLSKMKWNSCFNEILCFVLIVGLSKSKIDLLNFFFQLIKKNIFKNSLLEIMFYFGNKKVRSPISFTWSFLLVNDRGGNRPADTWIFEFDFFFFNNVRFEASILYFFRF